MDDNTPQVSFVPKITSHDNAPVMKEQINIFVILGILSLFISVFVWGGYFAYGRIIDNKIFELEKEIEISQDSLNTQIVIELVKVDKKIKEGKRLLLEHTTMVPLFDLLGNVTLTESVRFISFEYFHNENTFKAKLKGESRNLTSLSYQVNLFKKQSSIDDIIVSDISIDSDSGRVTFSLELSLNGDLLSYTSIMDGNDINIKNIEDRL